MTRPLGSKNKNPYPRSEKVLIRLAASSKLLVEYGKKNGHPGRLNGAKNKNPYPRSEKVLARIAVSSKRMMEYNKENGNPFADKTHSEESRKSMSETRKKGYEDGSIVHPRGMLGKHPIRKSPSEETRQKISEGVTRYQVENGVKPTMAYRGKFKPLNPSKYDGDVNNVIYRSQWELKFLMELDQNPKILSYSSEETIIPYTSPKDNRLHRYYPDMKYTTKENGNLKTYIVEIKPFAQTQPPKKKSGKRYIREVVTYGVNQAKFEAAKRYCDRHGYEFKVLTERELKTF